MALHLVLAQFGKALHLGCREWRFKSFIPDHNARVLKLVNKTDLKSVGVFLIGSSPITSTMMCCDNGSQVVLKTIGRC